jgi:hypothetical protein
MSEDLTLSMYSEVIEFANNFSQRTNKPLSKIIEDYLIELREKNTNDLPKDIQEFYGIFEGIDVSDKNS